MLESGRRNADRFQGEFFGIHFPALAPPKEKRDRLDKNLQQALDLGAEIHALSNSDVVSGVLDFALQKGITQIFVDRSSAQPDFWTRMRGSLAVRLIRAAEGIDVVVYPQR
jgi:K+-sensing histidine kinase KdpD